MTKRKPEPHPLDIPPFLSRKGDKRTPEQHAAEFRAAADEYRAAHPEQFKEAEKPRPILDPEPITGAKKEKPMAKAAKAKKAAKPKVTGEGYKGHKAGSKIGQLHQCFDEKGEDAARKLGDKLGLSPATLTIQFSKYRNEGGSKAKTKPKAKAKAKPPVKSKKAGNRHAEIVA